MTGSERETVLITGASVGIGRELAWLFASEGCRLLLVARSEEALRAVVQRAREEFQVEADYLVADLARPGAAEQLAATLRERQWRVDVLVNNAGFGERGRFAELPAERQSQMVQLNVQTLTELSRLLLPEMLERGRGGILNVGSSAGFQPGPLMAVYYATKAYVLSFSEALYDELQGSGLTVTCLAPGATDTEFAARARMQRTWLFNFGVMSAAAVARSGHRAFRRGRPLVVPGVKNWLLSLGVRFVPRFVARKIARALQE